MKILIADDDHEVVKVLSIALHAHQHVINVARDAMQALMFAKQKPDAILLDLQMPGGGGFSVLQKLKASDLTRTIPVIVVSGSAEDDLAGKVRALGAYGLMTKPVDFDKLLAMLQAATGDSIDPCTNPAVSTAPTSTPENAAATRAAIRVLVGEDDPTHRRILQGYLSNWGFEPVLAEDGNAALAQMSDADGPRLVVLDWMMPGVDGAEICRRIRQTQGKYTYVVMLTAKGQKTEVVEGIEAGADDYLTKPFHPQELLARLRTGLRILRLEADLLKAQEALFEQATRDALTGLWNRRAIFENLAREFHRSQRELHPLAVILGDLDHFKKINDTLGHPQGDLALQTAAASLQASLRKYDAVGRFGGEEFMIIAPGCGNAEALALAERLRCAVAAAGGVAGPVLTMSFGVATTEQAQARSADDLVALADRALYEAKRAGRNCIHLLPPEDGHTGAAEARVDSAARELGS